MHVTAQQQPGCVSLLPTLPFEMGSHKWDVKGSQAQQLLPGVLYPMVVEPCLVPLSLCTAVSCWGTFLGSAIASGDPPAAFGYITLWIANFCVWCENIGSLVF